MPRDSFKREGTALRFFDSAAPDDGMLAYGPAAELRARQLAARNPAADLAAGGGLAAPVDPALAALVESQRTEQAAGAVAGPGGGDSQAQREAADAAAAAAFASQQRDASVDPARVAYEEQQRQAAAIAANDREMAARAAWERSGGPMPGGDTGTRADLERLAGVAPTQQLPSGSSAGAPASSPAAAGGMSVDPNFGRGARPGGGLVPTPGGAAGAAGDAGTRPMTAAEAYDRDLQAAQARAMNRPAWSYRDPGGTFARAKTVQSTPGPDPALVRQLEAAEHQVGLHQDAGAWVDAHEQQDLTAETVKKQQLAAEQQAQRAALEDQRKAKMGEVMGAIEAQRAKVAAMTVDPQKFWKDRTAGEAVGAGIAVALSDVGNVFMGRAGAPNRGLEAIQRGVDQEIERQVRDIGKAKGDLTDLQQLYQLTKEKFGDDQAALTAMQMSAWEGVKYRLENIAVESNSQRAVNAAQMVAKRIDVAQAERRMQLDAASRGSEATQYEIRQPRVVSGGGPDEKKYLELGKERARLQNETGELAVKQAAADSKGGPAAAGVVPMGTGQVDVSHLPHDERAKVRAIANAYTQGKASVAELKKMSTTDKVNPFDVGASVYGDDVAYSYAAVKGQGQTNKDQMEAARAQLANAWKVGGAAAVERVLDQAARATNRVYGRNGGAPGAAAHEAAPAVAYQPSPLAMGPTVAPPRPVVAGKRPAPVVPSPLMSIADIEALSRRPPANTGALDDILRRQYGGR